MNLLHPQPSASAQRSEAVRWGHPCCSISPEEEWWWRRVVRWASPRSTPRGRRWSFSWRAVPGSPSKAWGGEAGKPIKEGRRARRHQGHPRRPWSSSTGQRRSRVLTYGLLSAVGQERADSLAPRADQARAGTPRQPSGGGLGRLR